MPDVNYLEAELARLIQTDRSIWSFLQNGSLDGVWYWDLDHPEHEWMSPEFWRLFGVDPATKRHDPAEWQDMIHPEDLACALANFEGHCADPDHPYDQTVRYRHADGSTVWVRCRGIAIRDADGRPVRMLGAHNDVTREKRAELEALAAQRRTEEVNEELNAFAYGVSHDLKSPVNTVDMLLREVRAADAGGLSEEQRTLMTMAERTIGHMRALVEDLLDYTRLIGQAQELEDVPLERVAADVVGALGAEIAETGAEIEIGALPVLRARKAQIAVLLQNLISNAIRYRAADRPPRIGVELHEADDIAVLRVSDNGMGIDPKHHDRIFGLFSRLHRASEIPGSGLGLTLCRRIAQNHGGEITVQSRAGEGSTFEVSLPLRAQTHLPDDASGGPADWRDSPREVA